MPFRSLRVPDTEQLALRSGAYPKENDPAAYGYAAAREESQVKFQINKSGRSGQYWFAIKASNGQTLAHSEQYTSKQGAQNAISVIRSGAAGATVEDLTGERSLSY